MRVEELIGAGSAKAPRVGAKCTIHYYSDSEPCQVVKASAKTIWIRVNESAADESKGGLGMGHQNWKFEEGVFMKCGGKLAEKPDNFSFFKATLRKDGKWRTTGSDLYVAMGQWHKYYDWSF